MQVYRKLLVFALLPLNGLLVHAAEFVSDNFASPPGALWKVNGSAAYDSTNQRVRLTPDAGVQAGTLITREASVVQEFTASFTLYFGGDDGGADGATFFAFPGADTYVGAPGGATGFADWNMKDACVVVEFNTWVDDTYTGFGLENYVGVKYSAVGTRSDAIYPQFVVDPKTLGAPDFENDQPWQVHFSFACGEFSLTLATAGWGPKEVLSGTIPNFVPFQGRFGFSAGTGMASNLHWVDDVMIETSDDPCTPPTPLDEYHVNAGGLDYHDWDGTVWVGERGRDLETPPTAVYAAGGYVSERPGREFERTLDDVLYESERYGQAAWSFPVPNGIYAVTLRFAEFATPFARRVFDVLINNQVVLDRFCPFVYAGGLNVACYQTFNIDVTGGQILIELRTEPGSPDPNPKVSAIGIRPGPADRIDLPSNGFIANGRHATSPAGFLKSWLILGPFLREGGGAPGLDEMRRDYLTDGQRTEFTFEPRAGAEIVPQYGAAAASTGLHTGENNPWLNPNGVAQVLAWVDDDGWLSFNDVHEVDLDDTVHYAWTYIAIPGEEPLPCKVMFTSDDSGQVFINDREVIAHNEARPWGAFNRACCELQAGQWNKVMVKSFEGWGLSGFALGFEDEHGRPLAGQRGDLIMTLDPENTPRLFVSGSTQDGTTYVFDVRGDLNLGGLLSFGFDTGGALVPIGSTEIEELPMGPGVEFPPIDVPTACPPVDFGVPGISSLYSDPSLGSIALEVFVVDFPEPPNLREVRDACRDVGNLYQVELQGLCGDENIDGYSVSVEPPTLWAPVVSDEGLMQYPCRAEGTFTFTASAWNARFEGPEISWELRVEQSDFEFSDEFDEDPLRPGSPWVLDTPGPAPSTSVSGSTFTMELSHGEDAYNGFYVDRTPKLLLESPECGDWAFESRVALVVSETPSRHVGIILKGPDCIFNIGFMGDGIRGEGHRDLRSPYFEEGQLGDLPWAATMRVEARGNRYDYFYKLAEGDPWTPMSHTFLPGVTHVGLMVKTWDGVNAPNVVAEFEYARLEEIHEDLPEALIVPLEDVACTITDAGVEVTYTEGEDYDAIEVLRDGESVGTATGGSFLDDSVTFAEPFDSHEYCLVATVRGQSTTNCCRASRTPGVLVFQQGVYPDPSYGGTRDAHILQHRVSSGAYNTGGHDLLEEGGRGASDDAREILVAFDLSEVGTGLEIESAHLRLWFDSQRFGSAAAHDLHARRILRPWGEGDGRGVNGEYADCGDVTWEYTSTTDGSWDVPGAGGGADMGPSIGAAHLDPALGTQWLEWDITALVADWIADPDSNHGVKITQLADWNTSTAYAGGGYDFASSESVDPTLRPMLVIQTPAAMKFIRGDVDGNARFGMADVILTLLRQFGITGPDIACVKAMDFDDSGSLTLADVIGLLVHMFVPDSPDPPAPYPGCGADTTPDTLPCHRSTEACRG